MTDNKLAQNFTLPSLIKFTLPSTVMMVFMALYQMVDGVFVSNFVGADALAALNTVYPAISIVVAVAVMLATGGSAIIARFMGEGRPHEARESFSMICAAGAVLGVLFAVVGLVFIDPIIRGLGGSQIYGYCYDYLWVLVLSSPLSVFQMLFQNFLVTAGKPHLGLGTTVLGGVANILLDYLFVAVLPWGVAGAAWATAIGYAIPAIFGLIYFTVCRKGTLYFVRPKLRWKLMLQACANGSSEMVTNLATAVTTFLFNSIMLRQMGSQGVAAVTIILYAQFLLTAVFIGFSIGVAPIFSYNYGMGNKARTHRIFRQSLSFVGVFSALVFVFSMVCSPWIVAVFARSGTDVYNIAIEGFRIFSWSFLFAGFNIFSSALFTAFSNGVVSAAISFSRTFVFLVASLLLLPLVLGTTGVWLAVPVAEVISLVVCLIFLKKNCIRYGLTPTAGGKHNMT